MTSYLYTSVAGIILAVSIYGFNARAIVGAGLFVAFLGCWGVLDCWRKR